MRQQNSLSQRDTVSLPSQDAVISNQELCHQDTYPRSRPIIASYSYACRNENVLRWNPAYGFRLRLVLTDTS